MLRRGAVHHSESTLLTVYEPRSATKKTRNAGSSGLDSSPKNLKLQSPFGSSGLERLGLERIGLEPTWSRKKSGFGKWRVRKTGAYGGPGEL